MQVGHMGAIHDLRVAHLQSSRLRDLTEFQWDLQCTILKWFLAEQKQTIYLRLLENRRPWSLCSG